MLDGIMINLCNCLPFPWHRRRLKARALPFDVQTANLVNAAELRDLDIEHQQPHQLVFIVGTDPAFS